MHQTHVVGGGQTATGLQHAVESGGEPLPLGAACHPRAEVHAGDQLHHDEGLPALLAGLKHLDHVGVVEPRERSRLRAKPGHLRVRVGQVVEQLHRDSAAQLRIPGAVDHTGRAVAELFAHHVTTHGCRLVDAKHPRAEPRER